VITITNCRGSADCPNKPLPWISPPSFIVADPLFSVNTHEGGGVQKISLRETELRERYNLSTFFTSFSPIFTFSIKTLEPLLQFSH